jgi:hypothetical protein
VCVAPEPCTAQETCSSAEHKQQGQVNNSWQYHYCQYADSSIHMIAGYRVCVAATCSSILNCSRNLQEYMCHPPNSRRISAWRHMVDSNALAACKGALSMECTTHRQAQHSRSHAYPRTWPHDCWLQSACSSSSSSCICYSLAQVLDRLPAIVCLACWVHQALEVDAERAGGVKEQLCRKTPEGNSEGCRSVQLRPSHGAVCRKW